MKPSGLAGHAAEFKFESKYESPSMGPCLRLSQKAMEGFYCRINGRALEAVLWSTSTSDSSAQHSFETISGMN